MKNIALPLFVVIAFSSTWALCQSSEKNDYNLSKVTPQMVAEQEALCFETHLITKIKDYNRVLDTLSVEEIKTLFTNNLKYIKAEKGNIISQNQAINDKYNAHFDSLTKSYNPKDEIIIDKQNIIKKLVNNNHLNYRDTVQNGVYFNQTFENNKTYIKPVVRNKGAMVFKFDNDETIAPFYQLNSDSDEEAQITDIFYHDVTEKNASTTDIIRFPLNRMSIPKMKHVDSVAIHFKVTYLTKVDTVHFTKADIGVQKGKFKLLKMEDNYVEFEKPYDYYPFHKGKLLEEAYYNEQGQLLDSKFGLTNRINGTPDDLYARDVTRTETIVNAIKDLKTREDIYLTLRYLALKDANIALRAPTTRRHLLKGNVSSFTLYIENTRDTISFSSVLKNRATVKDLYVHKLDGKTDFIDKDGNLISSFPDEIDFVALSNNENYSDRYFYVAGSYPNTEYYFLDITNGNYTPLPYTEIDYLCPSLLRARINDNSGIQLVSAAANKKLSDIAFKGVKNLRGTSGGIVMFTDDGDYNLYDQNNLIITPGTSTPITKLSVKKIEE